jgi:hypothetical protein
VPESQVIAIIKQNIVAFRNIGQSNSVAKLVKMAAQWAFMILGSGFSI